MTPVFAGHRYQIVGLGRNGLAAAHALRALGAEVAVWDDAGSGHDFPVHDPRQGLAGFTALVLSPGIPHLLPHPHPAATAARAACVPILSDAELLFRAVRASGSQARFVGVTGTNGKSTTTALIAHILAAAGVSVAAGGNLGPAALALPLLPDAGVYVLEMSSYMLERIAGLRFDAAVMLNLTPDHLDRHGDMEGYARAKAAIFARQTAADLAVVGVDDAFSAALARDHGLARLVRISEHPAAGRGVDWWPEGRTLLDAAGPRFDLASAPKLPGTHNAENIAASLAVAEFLGLDPSQTQEAVRSFPGLPHRQRLIAEHGGVRFIDDSKATNADAAARALACYDRLIWIAGGISKAGGIDSLSPLFPRVAHALLIGRDAPLLAATLAAHGVAHHIAGDLDAAVPDALALAHSTGVGVVLLSPACASFDQYPGFEARGAHFAQAVATTVAAAGAG